MTRYEELTEKAMRCRNTAFKFEVNSYMYLVWLEKAMKLEILANSLPKFRAGQKVEK